MLYLKAMKETIIPSINIKPKATRSIACATLLLIPFVVFSSPLLLAQTENKAKEPNTVEVEVKRNAIQKTTDKNTNSKHKEKEVLMKVNLSFVTYNKDRSLFVGYYQDGWSEMVSLHDAKTKKQLGSVYCGGGVPKVFRFSKDGNFLGAKASVGWYVWKIPKFEKVFILGDIDFDRLPNAEPQVNRLNNE